MFFGGGWAVVGRVGGLFLSTMWSPFFILSNRTFSVDQMHKNIQGFKVLSTIELLRVLSKIPLYLGTIGPIKEHLPHRESQV